MIAATMTRATLRILIAGLVVIGSMITTMRLASASPIDPTDGILSDAQLGAEDDVFTATMDVKNRATLQYDRIYVSFLNDYGTLPINGHTDVYTQTSDSIAFSQNDVTYIAAIYVPAKFATMVSIKGQKGDQSFDSAMYDLANDCSVLAVIDDVNDPISPYIYTRLACQLTQAQIDNAPEFLGDSLLSLTPLYTVNLPMIRN